jgi:hypothetical protein
LAIHDTGAKGNKAGFFQVVDAAGTNFSHPLAWIWPDSNLARPTTRGPWLNVQNTTSIKGHPLDTQQWNIRKGRGEVTRL